MVSSFHPFRALTATAGAFRDDLAPGHERAGRQAETLKTQVAQLTATWPFALAAIVCAPLLLWYMAYRLQRPDLLHAIELRGGIVIGLGFLTWAFLTLPNFSRWSPHAHVRAATMIGAGIAASLFSLLGITAQFPAGSVQLASFVAIVGAIVVAVVVLHPVRAATIGFAAALVGAITFQSSFGPASGIAFIFFLYLAIATYRLAAFDRSASGSRVASESQGRMAARLVHEFESHTTGWFWQTDSHGQVIYLSSKVATELDTPEAPAIRQMLTALFRMDSVSSETERTLAFHLSSRTAFSN